MKKKIYEILRYIVAKKATHNLGKVRICDDEIICYVDGKKLKKKEKYLYRYNLMFHSISSSNELYRIYRIDKPVHYIVENVDFDREINIMASMKNCHVTFENCTFTGAIEIDFADHITFKSNKYRPQTYKNYCSIYKNGEFCISTRGNKNEINKLEFLNDDISVEDTPIIPMVKATDIGKKPLPKNTEKSILKVWLYAKELILIDTDIVEAESIGIGADILRLEDEYLISKEIEIESNKIILAYTNIRSEVISIESSLIDGKLQVYHNGLFINGVEVDKNKAVIDNYDLELQRQRLEIINTFKKIGSSCEKTIADELRKQPLTRVLKK